MWRQEQLAPEAWTPSRRSEGKRLASGLKLVGGPRGVGSWSTGLRLMTSISCVLDITLRLIPTGSRSPSSRDLERRLMSSPTVPRGAEAKFKLGPDTGVSSRGWGPPQGAPRAPRSTEDSPVLINPPNALGLPSLGAAVRTERSTPAHPVREALRSGLLRCLAPPFLPLGCLPVLT